jgi:hypothetical protein
MDPLLNGLLYRHFIRPTETSGREEPLTRVQDSNKPPPPENKKNIETKAIFIYNKHVPQILLVRTLFYQDMRQQEGL